MIHALFEAGLLQFGSFIHEGQNLPFQLQLEMLPSYPELLHEVSENIVPLMPHADHILCTVESLALGTTISLYSHIPLVYSRGSGQEAVHDLVGAYDIGHPAVLLLNHIDEKRQLVERLIANARRVGLDIHTVVCVIDTGVRLTTDNITQITLFHLGDAVRQLAASGHLPQGQAEAVERWINLRPQG